VRGVLGVVSGVAATPPVDKALRTAPAAPPAPALQKASAQAPAVTTRLAKAAPRPARKADPCRLRPTPADRILCANPALEVQHRQMRTAYERALARGVDPLIIDQGQAEWRAVRNVASNKSELQTLYARRIRELNAARPAPRPPEEPPS
jgi:uncharacterized protein